MVELEVAGVVMDSALRAHFPLTVLSSNETVLTARAVVEKPNCAKDYVSTWIVKSNDSVCPTRPAAPSVDFLAPRPPTFRASTLVYVVA